MSKLTSRFRTTVPKPVRTALGLRAGDGIAYTKEAGRVLMKRAVCEAIGDPLHKYSESDTDADRRAYADL